MRQNEGNTHKQNQIQLLLNPHTLKSETHEFIKVFPSGRYAATTDVLVSPSLEFFRVIKNFPLCDFPSSSSPFQESDGDDI